MSETQEWHGWASREGVSLHVGMLPGGKRPSLYVAVSNEYSATVAKLGTFTNEDAARDAMGLLDHLIMGTPLPPPRPVGAITEGARDATD